MSLIGRPPSAGRTTFQRWAERLNDWLSYTRSRLAFFQTGDTPTENGINLWNDTLGYPVVSKANEWREVVLAGDYATVETTVTQQATLANTAYGVEFNVISGSTGITIDSTYDTRLNFSEGGLYKISGHIQIKSNSSSVKKIYLWLAIDGVDAAHSERETVKDNASVHIMPISDLAQITSGSYLEVKWAVDDVDLWLESESATAFAPASHAAEVFITRVHE